VGAAFAGLPFDHLLFTGATSIGRHVARAAAENLVPLTLELGGKSPVIVGRSANLKLATKRLMLGKTLNAGQACLSPDFAILPQERVADFVREARSAIAAMYPSLRENPDYTSIINRRHYDRLQTYLQDPERGCYLPTWCPLGQAPQDPGPGRVAWCYGDLGASLALQQVSAGNPPWVALARHAAARPAEADGVQDAGLCHGSAGNVHLFNRWYQATGEAVFLSAARAHLDRTLAYLEPRGFAGVLAFQPGSGEDGSDPHQPAAGLLEGAAGVGLALLSSLGGLDPAWDRFLLVSTPLPLECS